MAMTPQQQIDAQVAAGVPRDVATAAVLGGGGGGVNNNPDVFWGGYTTATPPRHWQETRGLDLPGPQATIPLNLPAQTAPNLKSTDDAIFWLQDGLFKNSPEAVAVRKKMIEAGIVSPGADLNGVLAGWANVVSLSAGALAHHQNITPFQYLDMWHNQVMNDQTTLPPTTETSVSRTVINPADLQAAYQQTAQNALGRRASASEAASAAGAVGAQAAASPTVTTTTRRQSGQHITSSSTTQQGMTTAAVDEALMQQAMQSPEYGAYQAAGHYFPALLSAIGATAPVGGYG